MTDLIDEFTNQVIEKNGFKRTNPETVRHLSSNADNIGSRTVLYSGKVKVRTLKQELALTLTILS